MGDALSAAIEWGKALAPHFVELIGALSDSKTRDDSMEAVYKFQRAASDEIMKRELGA